MGSNYRIFKLLLLTMVVISISIGCQPDELKGEYGVIFTDCGSKESEFVSFDESGKKVSKIPISARCSIKVQYHPSGGYTLPAYSDKKITHISKEGKVEMENVQAHVAFIKETPELTVIGYNNDTKKNTLEIREAGGKKLLEWKGVLSDAQMDEKYIYVQSNNIKSGGAFEPVVLVIDRKSKEVIKEIKLEEKYEVALSTELINHKLIIPSCYGCNDQSVASIDVNTWKVEKHPIPFATPQILAKHKDHLFVVNPQGELAELDHQMKVIKHKKISSDNIVSMRAFPDGLYLLRQDHNQKVTKSSGSIEIYDLDSWVLKKKITLPDHEMVASDLIRLKN
ncbi:hypothetical protein SAMN04487866_11425 [Thermoactinomyces sp. DSM 45891]|uniref:hypothetical protein n=1 Tax=Thermoactinomyces sp. DSM 45891 TaxID=1761907 RepID=UPI000915BFD0|nr:hypothetical protein [Thermoactinomyces sp. DSM 45891]SFX62097.1 hypothetical protein SAMN04487866_11425 [Thermoactinomyces sp. DSM 45891]